MSDEENYPRITITLPPDLAAWVKQKKSELEAKDRRMKTSVSAIIADAVAEMKARDQASSHLGQAMPDYLLNNDPLPAQDKPNASIVDPTSSGSVGGLSTRQTVSYRKGGRAK